MIKLAKPSARESISLEVFVCLSVSLNVHDFEVVGHAAVVIHVMVVQRGEERVV